LEALGDAHGGSNAITVLVEIIGYHEALAVHG
jgi:hypothetical protein